MKKSVTTPYGFEYVWKKISIEEAKSLLKEFNGVELLQFKKLQKFSGCSPYLLEDDRVIVIYPADVMEFSSLRGYMYDLQSSGFFKNRKLIVKDLPKQKIEYLLSGKKIYYYEIPKLEGEVIANLRSSLNKDSFITEGDVEIYNTLDSEVVEYNITLESYHIYLNKNDYVAAQEKRKKITNYSKGQGFSAPIMCGRNPHGERFVNKIDELILELPTVLHLPNSILDFSIYSLPKIEKYLYRNYITDDFADKIFLPLIAYIGKSFIKNKGGEWGVLYDNMFDTWVPDIKYQGKRILFYKPLLKILDSSKDKWFPLASVYNNK